MSDKMEGIFFHDFKNSYIPNILKEIYTDRIYDQFLLGRKDLVIADIGANIGLTAYYFKDYAARVYAVEPSRIHVNALYEMIEYNRIKNIFVLPFALGAQNMAVPLFHNTNKTMFSLDARLQGLPSETETVMSMNMETLMGLMSVSQIDFMKLDPEGAEGDIINSESFAKVCPQIKVIVGELHAWSSLNKEQFKAKFESLGYKFTWISESDVHIYSAIYGK